MQLNKTNNNKISNIQDYLSKSFWKNNSLITCFYSPEYPLLFSSFLQKILKFQNLNLTSLASSNYNNFNNYKSSLDVSILGQKNVMWLSDINNLDLKNKKLLLNYLSNYSGPHKIAFFITDLEYTKILSKNSKFNLINLSTSSKSIINNLSSYYKLNYNLNISSKFINLLHNLKLTLDQIIILFNYGISCGENYQDFEHNWLNKIIILEQTLFDLSSSFFSRDAKNFLNNWEKVKDNYPEQFWTVFWSEQLFRAHAYILLQKDKNYIQAKKAAYKLPFSFINIDWHKFSSLELSKAHDFMQKIDFDLRHGSSNILLDLFFLKFLNKSF